MMLFWWLLWTQVFREMAERAEYEAINRPWNEHLKKEDKDNE